MRQLYTGERKEKETSSFSLAFGCENATIFCFFYVFCFAVWFVHLLALYRHDVAGSKSHLLSWFVCCLCDECYDSFDSTVRFWQTCHRLIPTIFSQYFLFPNHQQLLIEMGRNCTNCLMKIESIFLLIRCLRCCWMQQSPQRIGHFGPMMAWIIEELSEQWEIKFWWGLADQWLREERRR